MTEGLVDQSCCRVLQMGMTPGFVLSESAHIIKRNDGKEATFDSSSCSHLLVQPVYLDRMRP